jgi:predicted dehydrogenase
MTGSTLKIGVIGFGYWGPKLVRNFASLPDCKVVRICDLRPDRLAEATHLYPTATAGTDFTELVNDPIVDAVVVATPVASHYRLALAALKACKHVFVEKPLATGSAEAGDLVACAGRQRRVLMTGHTYLYHGAVRKIAELIRNGSVGDLLHVQSTRANLGILQDDVNVVWDLAAHDLAILDFVADSFPATVSATGACHTGRGLEDAACISLGYPNGPTAHIGVSWISPVKVRSMIFTGTRRMIVFDDCEPQFKVRVYDRGLDRRHPPGVHHNDAIIVGPSEPETPALDRREALGLEAEDFVSSVRDGKRPLADGELGLRIVRLLEWASHSMNRGGQLVEIRECAPAVG